MNSSNTIVDCRVFCFSYAGAAAQVFDGWKRYLNLGVELIPVHYSGRGRAVVDPLADSCSEMVDYIWDQISSKLDKPYILMGYSMGSLISVEIAKRAQAEGISNQLLHILCAFPVERLFPDSHVVSRRNLNNDDLLTHIKALGGMHQSLLGNKDFMDMYLPIIRSDFAIIDEYPGFVGKPLCTNALVIFGERDLSVKVSKAAQWRSVFSGEISVKTIDDGHFFIHTSEVAFYKSLNEAISVALS